MSEDKQAAEDTGDGDDVRRKFLAALERKKSAEHASADSPKEEGKSSGPAQAKVKRQFRRKSG